MKLFGTDGVRGTANVEPMTVETALELGRAVGVVFKNGRGRPKILIGKDTRLSCYMLENAMAAGINSVGVDVFFVGPLPTPGIAFLTKNMRADAGVVISASHNPFQDNGIKLFDREGFKLPDELEGRIEEMIRAGSIKGVRPTAESVGKAKRIDDAAGRYIVHCKNTLPDGLTFEGLRLVLDCANGAAYKVAPLVFEELGAEVFTYGIDPNGLNINLGCGSLHTEFLCEKVREHRADLGIALDGDADRVIFADEKGEVVDGDRIMALCARDLAEAGRLAKGTVVCTVMSNMGLEIALGDLGLSVKRTAVGDRYVVEAMRKGGYNFGGEQSGHMIFLDHATTGDGIVCALDVLAIMERRGRPLSELRDVMTPLPQILRNVRVAKKTALAEIPEIFGAIGRIEEELADRGRLLVRYSGTEPLCRVMVEGEDEGRIKEIAEELAGFVVRHLG